MSSSSGAGKMSSSSVHSDRDAELGRLSGPELVARLQVTTRRADYNAAARVLDARDRRLAEAVDELAKAKAALAELKTGLDSANASLQALREKYNAFKAARSGPITGSSRGAIADPPPRGDGRAECADKKSDEVIDLCDSSDDEDALEEGEFRPDVARVSCKAADPTREGGEGRRPGVSCKRNAPAAHEDASESDDEDDRIPLSRLMKKRRKAKPVSNGVPKNGHVDAQVNSVGHLEDHPTERPLVNLGEPKASAGKRVDASPKLKEASFVQGRGRICQSWEGKGLSRAMPTLPPIDSAVGSKVDGSQYGSKIGGERGSAACPPFQVKTPTHTDMARRIVESARARAETPKGHNGSPLDASTSSVLNIIREQVKTIGGMQKVNGPLETGGIVEKACVVSRAIRKQQETQGPVLKA
ncbi:hypothetical protein HU200_047325 [Digitaria exilis]|uniref:Uncharacterized protein n=1 Tax=Digitaria exilis TaxID=1010633 RepID=A0A835ECW2_9POAL|nr:hypothetical protein HU200_047325 [Digitaria exilis]